ncbi:unnamed protein product [Pleuronectes platessa]|uniref:Uncharacterized protein n=1 Tax=Pleuronectes platessa TaxID=8262 RepID=A0A9N7UZR4_PLEPL|nr:unnamed protein product [Pleuronectes platessa]
MPSGLLRLERIVETYHRGSAPCMFNGSGVEVGKAQRCQSLAEDVVNFLGCGASDGAARYLLRIARSAFLCREGDVEKSHCQEATEMAADGLGT